MTDQIVNPDWSVIPNSVARVERGGGMWVIMRGGQYMVAIDDYNEAQRIVDRINSTTPRR